MLKAVKIDLQSSDSRGSTPLAWWLCMLLEFFQSGSVSLQLALAHKCQAYSSSLQNLLPDPKLPLLRKEPRLNWIHSGRTNTWRCDNWHLARGPQTGQRCASSCISVPHCHAGCRPGDSSFLHYASVSHQRVDTITVCHLHIGIIHMCYQVAVSL